MYNKLKLFPEFIFELLILFSTFLMKMLNMTVLVYVILNQLVTSNFRQVIKYNRAALIDFMRNFKWIRIHLANERATRPKMNISLCLMSFAKLLQC